MKYAALFAIILLISHSPVAGQTPIVQWQKFFGGPYLDDPASIEPTSDGGYVMAGYTYGPGGDVTGYHGTSEIGDYWVAKIDAVGTLQWAKCLGGTSFDQGAVIHQAPDGSYVVAGEASSTSGDVATPIHGGTDFWVVKLSATGTILSQKAYGGSKNEYLYGMQFTADGGYILAGFTESNDGDVSGNHGGRDFWVVKVNSTGAIDWQKCLGGSQDEEAYGVRVLADGSYAVAGYTTSNDGNVSGGHGQKDMWVVRLDGTGNLVWQKCLGGTDYDEAWDLVSTPDGGCAVAGYTSSFDGDVTGNHGIAPGDADFWVVKLSSAGTIDWQKCYGGSFNEIAYSIAGTPDGGFLVAGSAASNDGDITCYVGNLDGWVIKITSTGVLQWQKIIGGIEFDEAHSVGATSDGGAIVAIYSASKELPGYHADVSSSVGDFLVVKLSLPPGPPSLSILAPPANICAGTSVTLQTSATNVGLGATYQWTRNGANVGTNSPTYTASDFANGDQVSCTVTTPIPAGCSQTNVSAPASTVVLAVSAIASPVIQIAAGATVICKGTPLTFTANVTGGNPSPVYQWLVNGSPAAGATNSPSYVSSTLNNGDVVSCVYSDAAACVAPGPNTSNTIPVQVIGTVTPSVSITATAMTVCATIAVNFRATAVNGGTAPAYQWQVNGSPAPGATNSPSYTSTTLNNGDIVNCVLTSNAVCSTPVTTPSNDIAMTVKPATTTSVQVNYAPASICSGDPVLFTAVAAGVSASPVYQWQVNGRNAGSNSNTYTSSFLRDGDIVSCQVSDPTGACILPSSGSVTVIVHPTPTVATGKGIILTPGQQATLDLSPTGDIYSYLWSPAIGLSDIAIANPIANPAVTTTYTLKVTTAEGCEASGTITVKVFSQMTIPNAFTPNGDGHNDVFYVIGGPLGSKIKEFGVFDRWGQRVFQVHDVMPDDRNFGWDGRINGSPAPTGTYVYEVAMTFADGSLHVYKGTVMLIR